MTDAITPLPPPDPVIQQLAALQENIHSKMRLLLDENLRLTPHAVRRGEATYAAENLATLAAENLLVTRNLCNRVAQLNGESAA